MSEELPVWNYMRDALDELTQPQEKEEAANFMFKALGFSTWHMAVRDRANLPPDEYSRQFQEVVDELKLTGLNFKIPDQNVFKLTAEVCDQFIGGKVDMEKLNQVKVASAQMKETLDFLVQAIYMGLGDYRMDKNGYNGPKAISDSYYPASLAEKLMEFVSPDGMVILPPVSRKLLVALITDEASFLKRITPSEATPG